VLGGFILTEILVKMNNIIIDIMVATSPIYFYISLSNIKSL